MDLLSCPLPKPIFLFACIFSLSTGLFLCQDCTSTPIAAAENVFLFSQKLRFFMVQSFTYVTQDHDESRSCRPPALLHEFHKIMINRNRKEISRKIWISRSKQTKWNENFNIIFPIIFLILNFIFYGKLNTLAPNLGLRC